jgi:thiol:disulfide interchange protein DsbD
MYSILNAAKFEKIEFRAKPEQHNIKIHVQPEEKELIYADHIDLSIDNIHLLIENLHYSKEPKPQYSEEFKSTQNAFSEPFDIIFEVHNITDLAFTGDIHLQYINNQQPSAHEKLFPIEFTGNPNSRYGSSHEDAEKPEPTLYTTQDDHTSGSSESSAVKTSSYTDYIQHIVLHADSLWIQLLLAFLLGLLLSLTPCIYPMIPITIGILHGNGQRTFIQNLLGSLSYAAGIATTFALLGLFTAYAGAQFGSLLSNPIFVSVFVIFLGYMSLTMLGVVNLYIPSFMQKQVNVQSSTFGPYLSAFVFGAVSGTVASPCVSPGLALILGIVAGLKNAFLGFLLLFMFGIGISMPLVIIGTFSSSMHFLPRSGQWMEEIKKLIGLLMMGICVYYVQNIISEEMAAWLFVAYTVFISIYLLLDAQASNGAIRAIKNLLLIGSIALTVLFGVQAYEKSVFKSTPQSTTESIHWLTDLDQAKQNAQENNTLVLLDFYGKACSICKAIDKKIFAHASMQELSELVTFVKINGNLPEAKDLLKEFNVRGFPSIFVIHNDQIVQQWTGDLYNMTPQEFVTTMKQLHQTYTH